MITGGYRGDTNVSDMTIFEKIALELMGKMPTANGDEALEYLRKRAQTAVLGASILIDELMRRDEKRQKDKVGPYRDETS